jgi:hypothetical protein
VSNNNNSSYQLRISISENDIEDEIEESNCEHSSLDETTAKKLEKIAKKHAGKSNKEREYHSYKQKHYEL